MPLTREHWVRAALAALMEGGPAAVAVEAIAKRLGATKGSFYWHFTDRNALLQAALEAWEEGSTTQIIAALEHLPEPADRLRGLLATAFGAEETNPVEVAIGGYATHAEVGPVVERVFRRRVEYIAGLLKQMAVAPEEAEARGLAVYAAMAGWFQLRAAAPALTKAGSRRDTVVALVEAMALGPLARPPGPGRGEGDQQGTAP